MACSTALITLAVAPTAFAFKPRKPPTQPKTTTTTGVRRGCLARTNATVAAIAPRSAVGFTTLANPTLTWYVPDEKPFQLRVEIFELTDDPEGGSPRRSRLARETVQSTQGMMQWQVPEEVQLETGKRYLWRAILFCNPNRPSTALLAVAELERQTSPAELQAALAQANTPLRRAEIYREAGFWYEALTEALTGQTPEAVAEQRSLLEDLLAFERSVAESTPESKSEAGGAAESGEESAEQKLQKLAQTAVKQLEAILAEAFEAEAFEAEAF